MTGNFTYLTLANLLVTADGELTPLFTSEGEVFDTEPCDWDYRADVLELLEEAVRVYKEVVNGASSSDDIPEKLKKTVVEPIQKFGASSASSEDADNGGENPVK